MRYIYGPVPSRRLGRSLGVDPIPSKTCNYQCIYCQLGKTTNFTNTRSNFIPKYDIQQEIKAAIRQNEGNFDYITFVGSGEPTLYKDLKELIETVKRESKKPICVITNGSLLYNDDVKQALNLVNVVLPSLDAWDQKSFRKIHRPHPTLNYNKILNGLIKFRNEFNGKFWIEIMLMKNINDSEEQLIKIKEKIDLINPDRVDINVPIRPPTEDWVKIPDKSVFSTLNSIFGSYYPINFPEIGNFTTYSLDFEKELLNIIERHPLRQNQIFKIFSKNFKKTLLLKKLKKLQKQKIIQKKTYGNVIFWKKLN
jgi:wyosine [tRNA(Phe)-imidazoG37] synthetase (radical SAM superfamily)